MKQTLFEVLVYLFHKYIENELPFPEGLHSLLDELEEAGFELEEIHKYVSKVANERDCSLMSVASDNAATPASSRIYTEQENRFLNAQSRGLLIFIENIGLMSSKQREFIIENIMATGITDIDLEQFKWLISFILSNPNWDKLTVFDFRNLLSTPSKHKFLH